MNCGDVIIAKASAAYAAVNFGSSKWGTVTCSGGNNVAWLKCETFDGCKITASATFGMYITKSYWGVQGWEVAESGDNGLCFGIIPAAAGGIHHIILANNICNGGANGFASSPYSTTSGVDYLAILGNISWNAAQSTVLCNSGITVYDPIKSDSVSGTHIYIAGNFSFDNDAPHNCLGGSATYDGNGIVLDDIGCTQTGCAPYNQQIVVENNIAVFNGGYGFGNTGSGTTVSPIYYRYNTSYGNVKADDTDTTTCGDSALLISNLTAVQQNLIMATAEHSCSGGTQDYYAFAVNGADSTDVVSGNWLYSAVGQNTLRLDYDAFNFGSNMTGTNPNFVNPVDPGQPNCSGKTSTVDCMSTVIANYTPQAGGANAFGYQSVKSATQGHNMYFPMWLCDVTLPTGIITTYCGPAPTQGGTVTGGALR